MELATQFMTKYLCGLAKCAERDLSMTAAARRDWQKTKATGKKLFVPEVGRRHEVFNERPMSEVLVRYCIQDVQTLPQLCSVYMAKGVSLKAMQIKDETANRLNQSQSSAGFVNGKHAAFAPPVWY
jgi:exonuclease 3'-5' domain-containing protein 1